MSEAGLVSLQLSEIMDSISVVAAICFAVFSIVVLRHLK